VNLDNVATAICKGSLWVGCGGGTGTLNVHGGSHFDVTSDVKIGDGYEDQETEEKWNGKGTIHVHGCAPGAVIQPNDSSASSSVLSIGGCISVGWPLSEGYFKISSGASASSKGAELGVLAGGVANVTIDGEYSRWANEGDIRTGTGKTTLTVQNNGSLENQGRLDFYSGENALYISSGGHIKTTTGISAGGVDSQTSLCIVDGGLFDVTGGSMLGQGGRVDVLVSGVNSMWSQSNAGSVEESMVLGQSGEGLLTIKSGGTVNVNNLSTAVSSNSTGKLVVEDVDAKLKVSNALCVGVSGKGSLAVNARASAVAESITVGQLAGSTGSVSVVGRDASLRSSMSVLGGLGTASLTISGGGYVENANAVVAGCAGSESTVTVSEGIGSDSAVWTIHDALIVGGSESSNVYTSGGVGTLNVDGPNALVHIGKRLILGDDAKVNIASSGMITIGEMNAASQTGLIVGQGGILEGTGTISASVLNRGGTICPGHSPGILHVASLDNSEGTIVLEVCGSTEGQYDQIVVDGQLTLGGDIQIAFVNGYVPRPTDKFAFFKCSSLVNLTDAHVVAPNDVSEGRLTAMDGVVSFVVPSTIGTLSISTTPVNGEVFVDGESWGITPVSKKIAAGQHTVSFGSMDNCSAPTDQIATVTADQTTTITGTYVSAEGNEDGDDGSSGGMCGAAGVMAILATVLAGLCLGYTGTKE
jgi:T5SS/PEP-CTERM-associated repeat protein